MKSSARPCAAPRVAAVDRHPPGEPAHDQRGRRRDPDAAGTDDADRQPCHARRSFLSTQTLGGGTLGCRVGLAEGADCNRGYREAREAEQHSGQNIHE